MGPVLGPHTRTDRTRDTRVAEPWLLAPGDGRPGEGQRLTPDASHNGGRPPPPGDGPPPSPRHAAPTGRAGQGDSVGPPHPHTRAHSTWVADPNSPPSGRAVGGGTAPDLRRPSQWWKAPPRGTPFCHPHSEQRRPARAHAVGPLLGPHARTDHTRDTPVAEPWLPAPEDGRPGEGQRLTQDAPQNGGGPPPPGTAPQQLRGTQPPRGMQAKGTVLGPHTHTPAPTARGWRTPTARPVGGQSGEEQRLTSDASHNGGRHPPPPGDTLPPPPQRATPARKGARYGAGAGSPRPHRPHPGHTGRGTLSTRSRGRAAGGGTAPYTRRPPQRWQATPPRDGPPPAPRHAPPTGHAGQGDSVGPPHPHTRAHSTWVADPNSPPSGRAVGGGTAPDLRHPSQWLKAAPPGTPFRHPDSEQCRPARAHAVGPVMDPHTRTDRTRDTRVAEPWLPAPEDGRPGEGQRLTPDAPSQRWQATPPGDGPPPPPRHAAPTGRAGQGDSVGPPHPHTRAHSTWVADPNSPPSGRAVGGGTAPDLRRPSQWWKTTPPGSPFRHPHSEQRRPAGAHAVGPVLDPHARTDRTRDTRVAEPWLPAPEDGRPGEGQRLTPDAPHNGGRPPPTIPAARSPHGACRPREQCWARTPTHPRPQHVGGGPRQRAQWAGSWGEGQRLTSDAPHNGGRHPPRGRPSATPKASNAGPQGRTLWGWCWVPTPWTAPGSDGSRDPGCPLQRTGGRRRDSA